MAAACIEFRKAFCSHRLVEVAAELAKVLHSSTLPRVKRGGSAFVDDPFGGVGCIFIFLFNVQLDVASFYQAAKVRTGPTTQRTDRPPRPP